MTPDAKQRAEILKSIKKRVLANHINVAGIDYSAWAQHVDARTPELLDCEVREFEDGVRQLLAELKTSHTVFYHSLPKELLPQHTINASLRECVSTANADGCFWMCSRLVLRMSPASDPVTSWRALTDNAMRRQPLRISASDRITIYACATWLTAVSGKSELLFRCGRDETASAHRRATKSDLFDDRARNRTFEGPVLPRCDGDGLRERSRPRHRRPEKAGL